ELGGACGDTLPAVLRRARTAIALRQVVGDVGGDHAAMRAHRELTSGELLEVAPHGGLGDAEFLGCAAHGQPTPVGQQRQHGLPPLGAVGPGAILGRCTCDRITHLTLPAVSPPIRRFSISANSATTGRIATMETPNRFCQEDSY